MLIDSVASFFHAEVFNFKFSMGSVADDIEVNLSIKVVFGVLTTPNRSPFFIKSNILIDNKSVLLSIAAYGYRYTSRGFSDTLVLDAF